MEKPNPRPKICLICSAGGHFKDILKLEAFYKKHNYFFVMFYKEGIRNFIKKEPVYLVMNPERNPLRFLFHFVQIVKIFLKEKPDFIISTGAGVAVGMCYLGRIFGKKVIFIEDWCNISKPSLTGRLIYPIASLFIIQHKKMLRYYPEAIYGGSLF